jgi:transposase
MRRLQGIAPRAALSGYKEASMGKRGEKRECRSAILEPDAAEIDIGAEEIYVAVPPDRDEQATRRFSSFTCDLYALAEWLECCRIRTVAMESTGVYWIPLFQILEERGFKVYLVNAHSLKTVPGRKSDVSDCEWIQYLHSVGLLKASFRPPEDICAVRTLWRHRGSLLQMAAEHTQHRQKSLSLMNLQIHHGAECWRGWRAACGRHNSMPATSSPRRSSGTDAGPANGISNCSGNLARTSLT